MTEVYKVCIPHTNKNSYDYQGLDCKPCIGARVWVPFRNQQRLGIVIAVGLIENAQASLKSISEVLDQEALISQDLLHLCTWVASYYQSNLSEVLPLALPKKYRLGHACSLPTGDYYQLAIPAAEALARIPKQARKQQELVQYLQKHVAPIAKTKLVELGFNSSQLLALLNNNCIALTQEIQLPNHSTGSCSEALQLNPEQKEAVAAIVASLGSYHCFLVQGVTGSGKTEVYLQVIAQVLAQKQQVLILVPEIGLTPQLVARFTERFQQPIAVLHSHLNETERQVAWQLAKEDRVSIVIGTRSAVFTPMPNLGLIVIDEEHDTSLKQMDGVRYSARDTSLMRAYQAGIPLILGSATPSLESIQNCKQNKYQLLRLNHKALSNTPLQYLLVDLRAQQVQHGLAPASLQAIASHLKQNQQVLVFINRRGFAPVLLCHQCGWMVDCRACDSHLTMHRQAGQMICHHCGLIQGIPSRCHHCQSNELIPVGAGTQRVHEFLTTQFPQANILRIDRDEVRKKHALQEQLDKIHSGEAQIIVGTQMLAKGHHFPRLSLVVVLDADAGLNHHDFRALEQLGQLLTQVSGRAGRAEYPGQVLIQTHVPNHPLLNQLLMQGYDAFADSLLQKRQQAQMPPYHYLALLRAQSRNLPSLMQFLMSTKEHIQIQKVAVMGPAPAPLPRKAHQHRMQLLLKSPSRMALKSSLTQLREWLTINKLSKGISWNVDVDPMDLS